MGHLIGVLAITILFGIISFILIHWSREEEDKFLQPYVFVLGVIIGIFTAIIPITQIVIYMVGN